MIKKTREEPMIIGKLRALNRRLEPNHPKRPRILMDLKKYETGFKGEQLSDYPLKKFQDDFTIMQSLRLKTRDQTFFQMDVLLMCPAFFLIVEVKHLSGELLFTYPYQQLLRITPEKRESFPCPILQVNRQTELLRSWLLSHKFPDIPIKNLVLLTHPNSIVTIEPNHHDAYQKVVSRESIPPKIDTMICSAQTQFLNDKVMKNITRHLIKGYIPHNPDVLQTYHIGPFEIIKGVYCPQCACLPMLRLNAEWFCSSCKFRSKKAHVPTILDYYSLFGETMTNTQIREMLLLSSRTVALKMMRELNMLSTGRTKNRIYYLSYPILKKIVDGD